MSRDELWEMAAKQTRPSLTRWVGPLLYSLARLVRAKVTLEIGVGRGFTSFALGLYARNWNARHYSMDSNPDKVHVVNKINEDFSLKIIFISGDASERKWKGAPADLLFIDILGDEDIFTDIFKNLAWNSVRENGLIVIHDYFCFDYIERAVNQYFRGWEMLTIPHDGEPRMPGAIGNDPCGLAIIRR